MPRPDLVIYLDVPIATSQKWLHMEAGKKLDRNEKDVAFQKRVASIYTKLSKQKEWVRIACTSKSTPAQIHETVWRVIRRFLK
jgi:thymidylate kinase